MSESGASTTSHAAAAATLTATPHAGVAVLTNRPLWDLIMAFMKGYPYFVHKFYQENKATTLLKFRKQLRFMHVVGRLTRDGVLPHLAIATNNPEMLRVLYNLRKQQHRIRHEPKLSFDQVMRCAVRFNRLEMLECIGELKAKDPTWAWEPGLMRIALQRDDPDVQVLDWLFTHLPREDNRNSYVLLEKELLLHTRRGDLSVVQRLCEHQCEVSQSAVDTAARLGFFSLLRYFYQHSSSMRCSREVVNYAAEKGYLDIVKLIVEHQVEETVTQHTVKRAARHGQLEVVKYLLESNTKLDTPQVMDCAAAGGHLSIVKYLHETHSGGCTAQAMGNAANRGRMDIIKFLHENRTEGCALDALSRAARSGHMEVVKLLREKYGLRCSAQAMDEAAEYGHLVMIKFLHESKLSICSPKAMEGAASSGRLEVVKFLHENKLGGSSAIANAIARAAQNGRLGVVTFLYEHNHEVDVIAPLRDAALSNRLEVVKFLHEKLRTGESAYTAVEAAAQQRLHTHALAYLCANQEREQVSFVKQAVVNGDERLVYTISTRTNLSAEELVEVKALATEQNLPQLERVLARAVELKRFDAAHCG